VTKFLTSRRWHLHIGLVLSLRQEKSKQVINKLVENLKEKVRKMKDKRKMESKKLT
jgi:hypothetical protein